MSVIGLPILNSATAQRSATLYQLTCVNRAQAELVNDWLNFGGTNRVEVQRKADKLANEKIALEMKLNIFEQMIKRAKEMLKSWADSFGPLFKDEKEDKEVIREVVYVNA